MTITTPSGIVVEAKERPTFGDKRAVKMVIQDAMSLNIQEKKARDLTLGFMSKSQDVLFERVILSITYPDGKRITEKFIDAIYDMDEVDGDCIFNALDEKYANLLNPSGVTEEKKTE